MLRWIFLSTLNFAARLRRSGMSKALILFCLSFQISGCASYFTRKSCEQTNWFQYGEKVAGEGRRLSGDGFLDQCRKVEAQINETQLDQGFKRGMANYCQPESVFNLGKRGEFYAADLCEGENSRSLLERHRAGVTEHCQKTNGFTVGASGRPYNRICPKELEAGFMLEFNRGRKRHLATLANEKEKQINDIEREIIGLERERSSKQFEVQRLAVPSGQSIERKYDPATGTYREQVMSQLSEEQKRDLETARSRLERVESQISRKRQEQIDLREAIRKINLEIAGLE